MVEFAFQLGTALVAEIALTEIALAETASMVETALMETALAETASMAEIALKIES